MTVRSFHPGGSFVKIKAFAPAFFLSVFCLCSSAFAQQSNVASKTVAFDLEKNGSKPVAGSTKPEDVQREITEALTIIQKNYGGTKSLDYNEIFKQSISGMLHSLDPHSNYFDAKEFDQFKTDQSSQYFGIGATIGDLADANGDITATYIKATFDQAPANLAGLRYGDKIVEVNGVSMLGKPFSEVRSHLRGPRGTVAKLVVERLGTGKRETIQIVRDAVSQPSIRQSYIIRPGVGYMKMDGGFNQTTYGEFIKNMRALRSQGMQQLVLDLRDNGGGLVGQAYRIANLFLSEGQTVFTQKGRYEGATEQYSAQNPNPERSPIVILVNRSTASASEILAGALQDHDRALIVGEGTFGKGLVQNPFQLEYGSMLLLTIAKYQTPAGRLIQRDYSNGDFYSYYTDGGSFRNDEAASKPRGAKSLTDSGRAVYSGGGITPDFTIKPETITIERDRAQKKLVNPIFAFALELISGKVKGFENYKVDGPIIFDHDVTASEYPVKQALFDAFKQFAGERFKVGDAQAEAEREFVVRTLRSELVTAAYGSEASLQTYNEFDNQLSKAIDLLPQAKQLALDAIRVSSGAGKKQ